MALGLPLTLKKEHPLSSHAEGQDFHFAFHLFGSYGSSQMTCTITFDGTKCKVRKWLAVSVQKVDQWGLHMWR